MSTELPSACVPADEGGSCSICGDEGLVAEVIEVPAEGGVGRVRLAESERQVAFDLLEEVEPGDRVVVHMGFAIARVRERAVDPATVRRAADGGG